MRSRKRNRNNNGSRKSDLIPGLKAIAVVGLVVIVLGVIFYLNNEPKPSSNDPSAGRYPYQVGRPSTGEMAPDIELPSTGGEMFSLRSLRGKTVLLFFHEGIMCQACWDQLKEIEQEFSKIQELGIDQIISITTDPLGPLKEKVALEHIVTPVLSDPDLRVSEAYTTNSYSMMGKSHNGHTFIVVGPDGRIRWRADYGGPPKYTMYVPLPNLIADMKAGLQGGSR